MSDLALYRVIQEAQRLEISSNKALIMYRAAGGRIRRERWQELWRNAEAGVKVFGLPGLVRGDDAA